MSGMAILCSGQGYQGAGMFDLLADAPEASPVIEAAKFVLDGKDPRQLVREASNNDLHADKIGQILCCTQAMAAWAVEGALVHPLFDGAEGVLNDLAAAIENVWSGRRALAHAIERVLVLETGNRANVVRTSRAQWAIETGFWVTVVDLLEIAQPTLADRRQHLSRRAQRRSGTRP